MPNELLKVCIDVLAATPPELESAKPDTLLDVTWTEGLRPDGKPYQVVYWGETAAHFQQSLKEVRSRHAQGYFSVRELAYLLCAKHKDLFARSVYSTLRLAYQKGALEVRDTSMLPQPIDPTIGDHGFGSQFIHISTLNQWAKENKLPYVLGLDEILHGPKLNKNEDHAKKICAELRSMGIDPLNIPKQPGKGGGPKARVKKTLLNLRGPHGLTESQFKHGWEFGRTNGMISE